MAPSRRFTSTRPWDQASSLLVIEITSMGSNVNHSKFTELVVPPDIWEVQAHESGSLYRVLDTNRNLIETGFLPNWRIVQILIAL